MLCQSDDFAGNHTTTEAWPYLYYYCYYYECKSECMMNWLGLSDIISERGSILGGAAKLLYATDGFHDSNVR